MRYRDIERRLKALETHSEPQEAAYGVHLADVGMVDVGGERMTLDEFHARYPRGVIVTALTAYLWEVL